MTPSSIAPSRRCRCQSSGLVMVRLVVNGGPRLVDHFQAGLKPVRLPGQSKGNEDAALPMVSRFELPFGAQGGHPYSALWTLIQFHSQCHTKLFRVAPINAYPSTKLAVIVENFNRLSERIVEEQQIVVWQ